MIIYYKKPRSGNYEQFNEIDNNESDPFSGFCYYAGDETDGVLREGWTAYEEGSTDDRYYKKQTLWFYFKVLC